MSNKHNNKRVEATEAEATEAEATEAEATEAEATEAEATVVNMQALLATMLNSPVTYGKDAHKIKGETLARGVEKKTVAPLPELPISDQYMDTLGIRYQKLGNSKYYVWTFQGKKINCCFAEVANGLANGKPLSKDACIRLCKQFPSGWVNKSEFI